MLAGPCRSRMGPIPEAVAERTQGTRRAAKAGGQTRIVIMNDEAAPFSRVDGEIGVQRDKAIEAIHIAGFTRDAHAALAQYVAPNQRTSRTERQVLLHDQRRFGEDIVYQRNRFPLLLVHNQIAVLLTAVRQAQRNQQRQHMRIEMAQMALRWRVVIDTA